MEKPKTKYFSHSKHCWTRTLCERLQEGNYRKLKRIFIVKAAVVVCGQGYKWMIKISVANTIESMYVCLSMWPCCFFLNQVIFQNEPCDKVGSAIYVVVDCTLKLPNLDFHRGHLLACGYFGLGQLLFKMPPFFVLMNLIYRSSFLVLLWIYFILIDWECMLLYCLTSNVSQVIN